MTRDRTVLEVRVGQIWLGDDGVIRGVITLPQAEETLDDAIEIAEAVQKLCDGKRRPMFTDLRNLKSMTRETRAYLAREEAAQSVTANGILVDSPLSKMLANLYFRLNRPHFPVRLFTSEDEAVSWLRTFVE